VPEGSHRLPESMQLVPVAQCHFPAILEQQGLCQKVELTVQRILINDIRRFNWFPGPVPMAVEDRKRMDNHAKMDYIAREAVQ